jgi:ectoine hydroxylase-related dioxygenase (phytanoyl-CoA dioxygenase family)
MALHCCLVALLLLSLAAVLDAKDGVSVDILAARKELRQAGFVRYPSLLNVEELDAYRTPVIEAAELIVVRCSECLTMDDLTDAGCRGCERTRSTPTSQRKSFSKSKNLHRIDKRVRELVTSPRLAKVAAELLNTPAVRLYQDTAFFKEPGDVESSWHQDQAAAPLKTRKFLTIWVALDDMDADMGPLMFASESHCRKPMPTKKKRSKKKAKKKDKKKPCALDQLGVRDVPLSKRVGAVRHLTDAVVGGHFNISRPQPMKAGDATVHMGWTLHRAPPNISPTRKTRRAIAITYFADGAFVYPDLLTDTPGSIIRVS